MVQARPRSRKMTGLRVFREIQASGGRSDGCIQPTYRGRERRVDAPGNGPIPPLKEGDRLTRAEFERRYMAMPDLKKAELIEGVVHVGFTGPTTISWTAALPSQFLALRVRGKSPRVSRSVTTAPYGSALITCPSQIACCSFSRNMVGRSALTMTGISKALPTWSPRLPLAASALIWAKSLTLTDRNGVREYVVWRAV